MKTGPNPLNRLHPGMRWCSRCEQFHPHANFTRNRSSSTGWGAYCKPCKRLRSQEQIEKQRGKPDLTAEARFWSKVKKDAPGGCWLWTGAIGADGYGRFVYQGSVRHAHRVSLMLLGHDVPDGKDVDHCACKNRHCVAEAHLRIATEKQNALENNESPFAINARKTHCAKCRNPLAGENLAIAPGKLRGKPIATRTCLTCWPRRWMYSVIERAAPPRARVRWRGPFNPENDA